VIGDKSEYQVPSASNPYARGLEKEKKILFWLAEYQYSTVKIMSNFLGVQYAGQGTFFKRLRDKGFIQKVKIHTVPESVFLLTSLGKHMADIYSGDEIKCITSPKRIAAATVPHSLCVQKAIVKKLYENAGMEHTFERYLYFDSKCKLPDALLKVGSRSTALEVEMSHKNTNRVFKAFFDHIDAIKAKHYHTVEYVFPDSVLRNNYQSKFDQKEWPVVKKSGGRLVRNGETFSPDTIKTLRERFKFVTQDFGRF